jgi:uncharacterized surface protein with fasciclin (FAS1) repeats
MVVRVPAGNAPMAGEMTSVSVADHDTRIDVAGVRERNASEPGLSPADATIGSEKRMVALVTGLAGVLPGDVETIVNGRGVRDPTWARAGTGAAATTSPRQNAMASASPTRVRWSMPSQYRRGPGPRHRPPCPRLHATATHPSRIGRRRAFQTRARGVRAERKRIPTTMKLFRLTAAALAIAATASISYAQMGKNPMVGGKEMFPTKNIIENAVNSADHTTLVAAVKAAGLVDTLSGTGPFTVFAPTNAAFGKLPAGTVDSLLKPAMKPTLTKVLTYHVVAGKVSAEDLMKKIKDGKGTAELTTVAGGKLWAMVKDGKVVLKDEKGGLSTVTQADVFQSNGVIHVVDTVVMPS